MISLFQVLLALGLCFGFTEKNTQSCLQPHVEQDLKKQLDQLVRWSHFWQNRYLDGYPTGREVGVRVLCYPREMVVLASDLLLQFSFQVDKGRLIRGVDLGYVVGRDNDAAERDYVNGLKTKYEIVHEDGVFKQKWTPQQGEPHDCSDFSMLAPSLAPPDYIVKRTIPRNLAEFQHAVRTSLIKEKASIRDSTVIIPYYGPEDPAVFVFVKAREYQGWVEFLQKGNGVWDWSGKFNYDDNVQAHTSKQILKNELSRIVI